MGLLSIHRTSTKALLSARFSHGDPALGSCQLSQMCSSSKQRPGSIAWLKVWWKYNKLATWIFVQTLHFSHVYPIPVTYPNILSVTSRASPFFFLQLLRRNQLLCSSVIHPGNTGTWKVPAQCFTSCCLKKRHVLNMPTCQAGIIKKLLDERKT